MSITDYDIVIGLEVHAQLLTDSKIYAPDSTAYGKAPNTNVSVISLAHPGTMPKLNKRVVEQAITLGLACGSRISREQIFDRKNYFYPDLPKGYQLTQDRTPICIGGQIVINRDRPDSRAVILNRIHIEEDAGKSIHNDLEPDTLIDLNRAGVALVEIVTEPNLYSAQEAGSFLTEIRRLVRHLDVCDGNMEQGSLRCDANVSIKPKNSEQLGTKVEIKNLNSIKFVQKAIDVEVRRQVSVLEKGEKVIGETRLFNTDTNETIAMRTKEELNDYRYFPDPDLSPLHISDEWLEQIRSKMGLLPWEEKDKLIGEYGLSEYDAAFIAGSREWIDFFTESARFTTNYKAIANWIMGPLKSYQNESGTNDIAICSKQLSDLISLVDGGKISYSSASGKIFDKLKGNADLKVLATAESLELVINDSIDIDNLVQQIVDQFPDKVDQYRSSKKGKALLGMFMGELMKIGGGKLDPKEASKTLLSKLNDQ